MKKRVVIAGFGDTGVLVGIHLARDFEVIGISPKPCLVSGQELGTRLIDPDRWEQDYLMPFQRYKQLDGTRIIHGLIKHIDSSNNTVSVQLADGSEQQLVYDAMLISSGVSNGFWRNNRLEDMPSIKQQILAASGQLAQAQTIAIIGAGATGVSAACNLSSRYPDKNIHLFYSHQQILPGYHPRVRLALAKQLGSAGVELHPGYRALIPGGFHCDELTTGEIQWSGGQPGFQADLALWAVGQLKPNNDFIPKAMLNDAGFVKADSLLRVSGYENVFTVGDIAATDPNRSSARNWGWRLVANNIRAFLQGNSSAMKPYQPSPFRWGSIVGVQPDGLKVFQADGSSLRFPLWAVKVILFPLIVRKLMYKGVRKNQ